MVAVGPRKLILTVTARVDGLRIAVTGALDMSTIDALVDEIMDRLPHDDGALMLDLGGVPFCDSAGLAGLVRLRNHCNEVGGRFEIVRLTDAVRRVVQLAGLAAYLDV